MVTRFHGNRENELQLDTFTVYSYNGYVQNEQNRFFNLHDVALPRSGKFQKDILIKFSMIN